MIWGLGVWLRVCAVRVFAVQRSLCCTGLPSVTAGEWSQGNRREKAPRQLDNSPKAKDQTPQPQEDDDDVEISARGQGR